MFRRTGTVKIVTASGCFIRHGVVMALENAAKTQAPFELLRCGRMETPLYRYLGDAEELLGSPGAMLQTKNAVYRVLKAVLVTGHAGKVYVEALLERQAVNDDRQ